MNAAALCASRALFVNGRFIARRAALFRPPFAPMFAGSARAVSGRRPKRKAGFSAGAALSSGNPRASSRVKSSGQQREDRED
jgi:hypothetical protein